MSEPKHENNLLIPQLKRWVEEPHNTSCVVFSLNQSTGFVSMSSIRINRQFYHMKNFKGVYFLKNCTTNVVTFFHFVRRLHGYYYLVCMCVTRVVLLFHYNAQWPRCLACAHKESCALLPRQLNSDNSSVGPRLRKLCCSSTGKQNWLASDWVSKTSLFVKQRVQKWKNSITGLVISYF